MGNETMDVDLAALTEFDRAADRHAASFDKLVRTLEAARVGRQSFGMMPGSGEIFGDYEQRVHASLEGLQECADALRDLGNLVAECGEDYRGIETTLAKRFGQIADELGEAA